MILVFGKSGQVATELSKLNGVVCLSRIISDLSEPQSCVDAIYRYNPKAVINAAAYTEVDKAEDEEALAYKINSVAPAEIAGACKKLQIPLIHISTDYVFDGSGSRPWNTDDATAPLGVYGRSKRAGENAILSTNSEAVVLRTSWIFSASGKNFVKTMLTLAKTEQEISIISDQIGGPTSARSIAATCYYIATKLINDSSCIVGQRIYHFSGEPNVSWAMFAEEIFSQAATKTSIRKISTFEYPSLIKRPLNSRLDCIKIEKDFHILRPKWRKELELVLNELRGAK